MKRNQTDFINNLGIGAFIFLSILEFSGLIEYLLRYFLIITKTNSKIILWLPDLISLIISSAILIWIVNKYNKPIEIDTRKTLLKSIYLFFGLILLGFPVVYLGMDFLNDKFPKEFDLYDKARSENYNLQGYVAYIPIMEYLIFGIILLIRRKSVANKELW